MLKHILLVAFMAPSLAMANSYLPQFDALTAQTRSVTSGAAHGVTDGSPWWSVIVIPPGGLPDIDASSDPSCAGGTYIVFEDQPRGNGYDFTSSGLTQNELASVVSDTTMKANGCLP